MKKCERFALDHYLTSYPENEDFYSVLYLVRMESDLITVWEPFANEPCDNVADFIAHMASYIDSHFIEREKK